MGQGKGKKPATYEDIEALPIGWVGEIICDELYASPRPASRHLQVASRLGALLTLPFDLGRGGPGGWWFFDEPELHLGGNVLVPDLAGWRRERVPEPPDVPWMTLAPDWVCEVLSPSRHLVDRWRKMPLYHAQGVSHAWIIDPIRYTLEAYRNGKNGWVRLGLHEGGATVRVEPFEAVPLELALLWMPPRRAAAHP
ncbi:Uma2 family endonuclease [Hyalangium sp.]|uniref:Uma2 family endonuclease n=1 Tax=Hyalangium sp. TaxID=2028555 RepID=UPI002D306FB2|nr:Uma2 family endonuclease [Hyalangium sp.]HYH98697.1 Uma2 family endonuclease [Hyalangium sp.]